MFYQTSLLLLFGSAALTLLLCAQAKKIGSALDLMDLPDKRKQHPVATPLMGGPALLGIVVPISIATTVLLEIAEPWRQTLFIWSGAVATMSLLGILDDRHSLGPWLRLFVSFSTFIACSLLDPHFLVRQLNFATPEFTVGLGTQGLAVIFTAFCGVGLVNAINMADGKNGLVLSLTLGAMVMLATHSIPEVRPTIGIALGALLVLLAFNLRGRLFLGDGGAYGVATAIGLMAILLYNSPGPHVGRSLAAEEIGLIFAIPIADFFRVMFLRLARRQSPMRGDRNHLHHKLKDRWGWPGGLIVYLVLAFAPISLFWLLR